MSIVTFWGSGREQVGKTLSLVAIATNMAIEHNKKILIVSASYNNDALKKCYWSEKANKNKLIIGEPGQISLYSGIEGLSKIIQSNKITPELIADYTKTVFKNRLEVLLGFEDEEARYQGSRNHEGETSSNSNINIAKSYVDIVRLANQYYDTVFVDLDNEIEASGREAILEMSDVVVAMASQKISSIETMNKQKKFLVGEKGILLVGKYDKKSKYTIKNLTRHLGEKKEVLAIPYNTLLFEASEEGQVPDLFLKLRNIKDQSDENEFFMQQIRKVSEEITKKITEVRLMK